MKPGFCLAVSGILQHEKRLIKEDFFRFGLVDAMLLRVFAGVAFVPVKASDLYPVDHKSILPAYTSPSTSANQCRHGDAYYITPSAPFRRRACCKRLYFKEDRKSVV